MTALALLAQRVDGALLRLGEIPATGSAPPIDLSQMSLLIAFQFGLPSLSVEIRQASWRATASLKEGLGSDSLSLGISASPLNGEILWLMSRQDVAHLTSWFLYKTASNQVVHSEILQEGFYRYLAVMALDAISKMEGLQQLTFRFEEEALLSSERAYMLDCSIEIGGRTSWGRLVLSEAFLSSWQGFFTSLNEPFAFSALAKQLAVPMTVNVGRVRLSQEEWGALQPGDLLLLDRGSYDPRHKEGVAQLSLGKTALFSVHVKEHKLKILQLALQHEEPMTRETKEETPPGTDQRVLALKELPLTVTVELARMRMTIDQVMKLSPGATLDVPISPHQTVSLTVDGQLIGRGELIHLGDAFGVRIVELAQI